MSLENILDVFRRMNEGGRVYELVCETPGIGIEDQKVLLKALEDDIISAEFPPYTIMISRLSKIPGVYEIPVEDISWNSVATIPEVQGLYLRYILLPIALGKEPPIGEFHNLEIVDLSEEVKNNVISFVCSVWRDMKIASFISLVEPACLKDVESSFVNNLVDFFIFNKYMESNGRNCPAKKVYTSLGVKDKKKIIRISLSRMAQ